MKHLIYIALTLFTVAFFSCTDSANGTGDDNDSTLVDSLEQLVDSSALQEVRGVIVDGARRSIDLKVGEDTMNFELESSSDVEWEIGDSLTVRYYMTQQGDSVVEIAH